MIEIIAAASIGGIVGFGICAVLTAGRAADAYEAGRGAGLKAGNTAHDAADAISEALRWDQVCEADAAHSRCADALGTTQRKLSAIRDLLDKPRTIRKGELATILDGEVA